jgi:hypothetical protein
MESNTSSRLGWNLLWYIPVCLWFCAYFLLRNLSNAWRLAGLMRERWSWGFLISPSSAVFLAAVLFSFSYPIQFLLLIRGFIVDATSSSSWRRYAYAAGIMLAAFVVAVVVETVIWGSLPLEVDAKGVIHLRLIPFVPWPDRPYGSY